MKRFVLTVLGVLLGLLGLVLLGAGSLLLALFGTDGRTTVEIGPMSAADGRAIVVTDFGVSSSVSVPLEPEWLDLQLQATGGASHFVGVAEKADSLRYLQGVPYTLVTAFDSEAGDIDATTIPGDRRPAPPAKQTFWTSQQTGTTAAVDWPVQDDGYTLVVMNEDGSVGVDATVSVVIAVAWAGTAAVGLTVAGLLVLVLAIVVLVVGLRSGRRGTPAPAAWPPPPTV